MKYLPVPLCCKLLALFCLLGALPCLVPPLAALEVPTLQGRVNDTAAILSEKTVAELNGILAAFEASDSTQIVVLTIPSLQGDVLEGFSLRVVEAWKIGQKGLDNGALLLVSRDDRKIRIEVGYGLEGSLTDLVASRIINGVIVPRFKTGQFDQGVTDGVNAMVQAVRGEFTASSVPAGKGQESDPAGGLFLLFFAYAFLGKAFRKKKVVASIAGGIVSPLIGLLFFSQLGLWLLALVPVGMLGGLFAASLSVSAGGGSGHSGGFYMGSGGFGGSSGGFGGFSGGGGGFGGGGASGGW